MSRENDIEEMLLFWAPILSRRADLPEWERSFCADMAKRAHWRGWWPSPKQESVLRRICGYPPMEADNPDDTMVIDQSEAA